MNHWRGRMAGVLATLLLAMPPVAHAADAPRVLVAGGTGRTGTELVRQLVADGGFRVRVLARDVDKARGLFPSSVEIVAGNVRDAASVATAVAGADYVVTAIASGGDATGPNRPELVDYGGNVALFDAARAAGVRHVVMMSSRGVTQIDNPLNKRVNNVLVWKYLAEEHLRRSGLPYTIVRPGSLRNDPGGQAGYRVEQGDARAPLMPIPRADVSTLILRALGNPDAMGKTFEVVSDPATRTVDWPALWQSIARD